MSKLRDRLIKIINKKKKITITFVAIVVSATFICSFLLYKKLNKIPKFAGRVAYIKSENLRVRDYHQQKDYLLFQKVGAPEIISWSPLGKYIYTQEGTQLSVFDLANKNKIDTSSLCSFESVSEAKWTGKSDTLTIRDNNKFILCNLDGSKQDFNLKLEYGESILDWVPINNNFVIVLISNKENGSSNFLRLSLGDKTSTEIAKEKGSILGKNNKYLWFAEDRNFIYLTKGSVNRILLDENFNITYKNTVKIGENIQPLGWNLNICAAGRIFIPESKFLVLDKTENKPLVKQISFTAPQKYSSSEKDITLSKGETYWKLAERIFGDGSKWKELYKYNTKREPTQLQIGARIFVPLEEVMTIDQSTIEKLLHTRRVN